MRIHRYNDTSLLVLDVTEPALLAANINGPAVRDVAIGADSVMVILTDSSQHDAVTRHLDGIHLGTSEHDTTHQVVIEVDYAGPDLDDIAEHTGLSRSEVVAVHSESTFTVAFLGFAPGFAYLTGLDPRLHVPRLSTPRPHIPAGSVAIASEYSGIYPRSSPGGWRILGFTDHELFNERRNPPALLTPGSTVRFQPR